MFKISIRDDRNVDFTDDSGNALTGESLNNLIDTLDAHPATGIIIFNFIKPFLIKVILKPIMFKILPRCP